MDTFLNAILEEKVIHLEGSAAVRGARGEEGVGGGGRSKNLEHAVHLPEAGGGGFMSYRTAADLSKVCDPHGTTILLGKVIS